MAKAAKQEVLLEVKDLVKHFPIRQGVIFSKQVGAVQAVDGIGFNVNKGETLGLVGESGCGKTTAGRCILRLIEPTSGEVKFDGKDVPSLPKDELRELRKEMQIIF
ncbi:MAG TPA: peptide ABC transporter substrate-binding protein, partial [Firmicutes bacterium]|nr:peptide ABC transporter substrate-binding protein [Bacillota bacterium]